MYRSRRRVFDAVLSLRKRLPMLKPRVARSALLTWVILLVVLLAHTAVTVAVMRADRTPLMFDEAYQFWRSVVAYRSLTEGYLRDFISGLSGAWPPLHMLLALPFYLFLNASPDTAILSQLPQAVVLVISVYSIGKSLHSWPCGLFSSVLVVLLPGVVAFSRTFFIEFTLTCAVAAAIALMLQSRYFTRRGITALFGISLGVGLLVKWTFPLYVAGPFFLYLLRALKGGRESHVSDLRNRVASLLLAGLLAMILALPWYAMSLPAVTQHLLESGIGQPRVFGLTGTTNILYYPHALYTWLLGPLVSVVVFASLVHLWNSRATERSALLLAWFGVPYLILTLVIVQNKVPRFFIPVLPACAIALAVMCMDARRRLRLPLAFVVLLLLVGQYMYLSLQAPLLPSVRISVGMWAPSAADWGTAEMTEALQSFLTLNPSARILVISPFYMNHEVLESLKLSGALPDFQISDVTQCPWRTSWRLEPCGRTDGDFREIIARSDAVLMYNSSVPGRYVDPQLASGDFRAFDKAWNLQVVDFVPLKRLSFPDGDGLHLYVRAASSEILFDERPWMEETRFNLPLPRASTPITVTLEYLIHPAPLRTARWTVLINGVDVGELAAGQPFPWVEETLPIPTLKMRDGTVDVRIDRASSSGLIAIKAVRIAYLG